jgi:hypothetical protein
MPGQQCNILAPFAQKWNAQFQYGEAIIKILTEPALANGGKQAFVGGGNDTHIHNNFAIAADTPQRALLQRAQQFRLQARRHVAHFVDEQRAAIGLLEQADALFTPVAVPGSMPKNSASTRFSGMAVQLMPRNGPSARAEL